MSDEPEDASVVTEGAAVAAAIASSVAAAHAEDAAETVAATVDDAVDAAEDAAVAAEEAVAIDSEVLACVGRIEAQNTTILARLDIIESKAAIASVDAAVALAIVEEVEENEEVAEDEIDEDETIVELPPEKISEDAIEIEPQQRRRRRWAE